MRARRSVPRVFVGRLGIALLVSTAVMISGVIAVNSTIDSKLNAVSRVDVNTAGAESAGGNFLLIGSDTRAFADGDALAQQQFGSQQEAGGQRSDTMMVLHVEPDRRQTMIVSFPRDLWVTIPGVGKSKINAAFNYGPDKVIATLKSNFGIEINHYLEVDFRSFQSVVDATGKVPVYLPYPARDDQTGLYVPFPGCVSLDGAASLAYVRSRSLEYYSIPRQRWISADAIPDIDRIARQQDFIRRITGLAVRKSLDDPLKANDIADRVVKYLKVDQGLSKDDMLFLVDAFRDIDPNDPTALGFQTLPWTEGPQQAGQAVLYPKDPDWRAVAARLSDFGGGTTASSSSTGSTLAPSSVSVKVLNASGRTGIAATSLAALNSLGFQGTVAGNDPRGSVAATEVRYKPGAKAAAQTVAAHLEPSPRLVEDSQLADADVAVVLGSDFAGIDAPSPSGGAPAGSTTATTTPSGSSTSTGPSTTTFGPPAPKAAPC